MEVIVMSPLDVKNLVQVAINEILHSKGIEIYGKGKTTPQPEQESTLLTTKEFSEYSGLSLSHIYKLTHGRRIPFFRPMGKTIYFKKTDVDNFLLQNRQSTKSEIENEANAYLLNKKK